MATRGVAARGLTVCFAASLALSSCETTATPTVRSAADLHCSLPIHTNDHIGFVDFPSGRYREDPSVPPGLASNNNFALFYDKPAHRWINAGGGFGDQYFSPDGASLAYANVGAVASGPGGVQYQGFTDIYLLNVARLTRQHVGVIPGTAALIAFRPDGLYFNDRGNESNGSPIQSGVYRFDLRTGKSIRIGPNGPGSSTALNLWNMVTSAAAWGSLSAIPNQYDANPVQSMSLADGGVTRWYTARPTRSAAIVGFVGPLEPLVAEFDTEPYDSLHNLRFMVLTAPNVVKPVNIDPSTSGFGLTDLYGVWLGGPGRLSLYDSVGLISMADLSRTPIASETPVIAGRCS